MLRLVARATLLLLALAALISPAPDFARAQDACAGLVEPRLEVGALGRVSSPYGVSLKDRPNTGAAGAVAVTLLPPGAVYTVIDGFRCANGYRWWQVRLASGATGWAAEGDAANYFLEPHVVGLDVFHPTADRTQITHTFVLPDGRAEARPPFPVAPVEATPAEVWQTVETERLVPAVEQAMQTCPHRLAGTPFAALSSPEDALNLPLPPLDYDVVPAPDASRLLLVRHLHLLVPRCDSALPERIGISRVVVLSPDGSETELFPFAQHSSIPPADDQYVADTLDAWAIDLAEVVWAPDARHIAFVAAYRDACGEQTCYRFQMYVANLETGQLYILGEGRHVAWAEGGARLMFFRLVSAEDGRQVARLFSARPDGTDRQEIWLPGGAVYVSATQTPLGLPWNESGTRVIVGNAGGAEKVMVFDTRDKSFTPPVLVPAIAAPLNRLAVHLVQGETALLWTTIRGDFVVQSVRRGDATRLSSALGSVGVPLARVQPFATGQAALAVMADGSAYVLDLAADTLTPVAVVE
jgi:hypothetical protein